MSSYIIRAVAAGFGEWTPGVILGHVVEATDSLLSFTNADGTITRCLGSGFLYGVDGVPIAGIVDTIQHISVDGSTILADITGLTAANNDLGVMADLSGSSLIEYIFSGDDTVDGQNDPDPHLLSGGAGNDTITGSIDGDTIAGGIGNDTINAREGADIVDAGDGHDTVYGGLGGDQIQGGLGNDNLQGEGGDDTLDGGDGDDFLNDEAGNNTFIGGAGNDSIQLNTWSGGSASVIAGSGDDTLWARGGSGLITADLGDGNDRADVDVFGTPKVLTLGEGRDTVVVASWEYWNPTNTSLTITDFAAGAGGDKLDISTILSGNLIGWDGDANPFGAGFLRVVQDGPDTLLQVDRDGIGTGMAYVTLVRFQNVDATTLTTDNFTPPYPVDGSVPAGEVIVGTEENDPSLSGTLGNDTISGLAGSDNITAGAGADIVDAGDGHDTVYGGLGGDQIQGGLGNDNLQGEGGDDTLDGGDGDDFLNDEAGNNTFIGGAGNDSIQLNTWSGGSASVIAGSGDDTLWARGGSGLITADLGDGNDRADVDVFGTPKVLTLGEGRDTVVVASWEYWNPTNTSLTITDFAAGAGGDKLDISTILSGNLIGWDGDANPFGAGFLRVVQDGPDTLLQVDRDGIGTGMAYVTLVRFQNVDATTLTTDNFTPPYPVDGSVPAGEVIVGTEENDPSLSGTLGNDTISGLAGSDNITAGAGADIVDAGDGHDTVYGGLGGDQIQGGLGNDNLQGEGGDDTLDGGDGDDFLNDEAGNNTFIGGAGNDSIQLNTWSGGSASVIAGSGDDTLWARGGSGLITADLGDGNDRADVDVFGTPKVLTLGEGRDTVVVASWEYWNPTNTSLTITDFAAGAGGDKLDISTILSGNLIGWDGDANPFGAGFLRVVQDGPDTLLQVDRDGIGTGMAYVTLVRFQNVDATTLTTDNFTPGYPIIAPENHAPFGVTAFVPFGFIPENVEPGQVVATLSAIDFDAGDTVTFTLTGGDVELFEIIGNEVRLRTDAALDYETATSHLIEVVATDSHGATSGITQLTLHVSDQPDGNIINGTPGADTLVGTAAADTIFGYEGDDILDGGAGNDVIDAGAGNNLLIGGAGDDTLIGGPAFTGAEGNRADYSGATGPITVVTGAPTIVTGDASVGTDSLTNIDSFVGTAFNDQFAATNVPSNQFGTFVEFEGGAGDDSIAGNNATRISYRTALAGVTVDLAAGTGQSTAPGDVAGVGLDTFTAVNQVRGSSHDDTLYGSNTTTTTEVFRGLAGNDFIDGRGGQDRVDYNNSTSGVVVTIGEGGVIGAGTAQDGFGTVDTFVGIEQVRGSQHDDILTGDNAGNAFIAERGNDLIDGRGGFDTVDYAGNRATGIQANLTTGFAVDGYGTTDTLVSIENVIGSNFDDTITGDGANNTLRGQVGNDFVFGEGGNDSLFGGQGSDYLDGGAGDDVLDSGDGDDTLIGGTGFNTFLAGAGNDTLEGGTAIAGIDGNRADYSNATGPITVITGAPTTVTGDASVGSDTLINIDSIVGTFHNDSFTATNVASNQFGTFVEFEGRGGDDSIVGNGLTRVSYRTASAGVTVDLAAGTGQSTAPADAARVGLDTFSGANAIRGSAFDDTLYGSDTTATQESFRGQAGNDYIDGRDGQDRVEYANSTNGVVVTLGEGGILGAGTAQDGFGTVDTFINIENIRGSQQNDILTGDDANNIILGEAGSDIIDGRGGIDTADYGNHRAAGIVVDLATGTGQDGYGATDTLIGIENVTGSNFGDTISGDGANNALRGGTGNDTMAGGGGDDQVFGGADVDTVVFSGQRSDYDVLSNPDGSLTITDRRGIDGTDTINGVEFFQFADKTQTAAEVVLPPSNVINGTPGADALVGTAAADTIFGYEGDDILDGGAGNDVIDAGAGNNLLIGGAGDDTLIGGPAFTGAEGNRADYSGATGPITVVTGAPTIVTGDASVGTDSLTNIDSFVGTAFNDQFAATNVPSNQFGTFVEFEGGAGDDSIAGNNATRVSYRTALSGVTVDLAAGTGQSTAPGDVAGVGLDTFTAVNQVRGSSHDDTLYGSNTTATTEVFRGLAGNDFIDGRGGQDRVDYNNSTSGVVVTIGEGGVIGAGTAQDGFGTVDTFVGIEQVRGSQHDDILTGDNAGNSFIAERGNDLIDGRGGFDTVDYAGNRATGIQANLTTGFAVDGYGTTDTLVSIENVIGSNFDDTITGDGANNTLRGQVGNDFVFGEGGNDSLFGGQGSDYLDGGAGDDVLDSGDGDDTLIGGTGFNTFLAGAGNDTLEGGTAIAGIDGNRADYSNATGPITVITGAPTTVTGDASVGSDTLINIDSIVGTFHNDSFTATNVASNQFGTFVEFEGRGGDDSIVGNGLTRVSYRTASAGVTVDLAAGTGQSTAPADAARVGLDTFSGANAIRGSAFDDTLYGSDTTATQESFRGQAGNDYIDGRDGQDRVEYANSTNGVVVTLGEGGILGAGTAQDGFGTVDTFINIENIRGSQQNDILTGDDANNIILGEAGSDIIDGRGGIDTADYGNHRAAGIVVDLATGTGQDGYGATDTLIGIENVTGSNFGDTISGDGANNALRGGTGNDTMAGGGGDDQVFGGADVDTVVFSGQRSDYDVLSNPDGSLTITDRRGIDGTDTINGVEFFQFADKTQTAAEVVLPPDSVPSDLTGEIAEDLVLSDAGTLAFADLDHSAPATVTYATTSAAWSGGVLDFAQEAQLANAFSIDPAGFTGTGVGWTYNAGPSGIILDFLAAGETVTLTYDVTATDTLGASATETVTITVTGTNDAPLLTSFISPTQIFEDSPVPLMGTLNYSDVDGRGEPTLVVETRHIAWTGGALDPEVEAGLASAFLVDPYIGVDNLGSVGWRYQPDMAALNFLAMGEHVVASFAVTLTDSAGAEVTQEIAITITGSNDMPVITSDIQSGITEEDSTVAISGEITYTDLDATDAHSFMVMPMGMANWSGGFLDPALSMMLTGALMLSPPDNGVLGWSYQPAPGSLDFLAAGETLVLTQHVQIMDMHGGMAMQPITITVVGTNDGPQFLSGDAHLDILDGVSPTLTYNGQLDFQDADRNDIAAVGVTLAGVDGSETSPALLLALETALVAALAPLPPGPPIPSFQPPVLQSLNWSFALDSALVQGLGDGDVISATYEITITDNQGESDRRTLAVTITGTNSAAVLSADVITVIETDAPLTATGTLTISDLDGPEEFVPQSDVAGLFGNFSIDSAGTWTFVANSALNELTAGQSVSDVFSVSAADGTLTTVTVTITGTNDAPVVTAISESATEGGAIVSVDAFAGVTDLDAGTVLTVVEPMPLPDGVTYAAGVFTLDPTHGAFDSLAAGATTTVTVVYNVNDGIASVPNTITFTITGTNDAPTAIAIAGGHVPENSPAGTVVATLAASDADGEAAAFTLSGPNAELFEVVGNEIRVAAGATLDYEAVSSYDFIITATDPHGASIAQPLTISIDNVSGLIVGGIGNDTLAGTDEEDRIYGGSGADTLSGGLGDDQIYGEGGNDTLIGDAGADALAGGSGNDTYVIDAQDSVVEANGDGTDTVQADFSYTLGSNIENLLLTGSDDLSGTGNAAANNITGNAGANLMDGGAGGDTLTGLGGDDTYLVDTLTDRVIETATGGIDTVQTALTSLTLASNVENLVYTGSGSFSGTGNSLANTIQGGDAADTLSGGAGADQMIGGAGNDTYILDNVADVAVEADNGGTDTVLSTVTVTLADNVENLTLTGASGVSGTGNALDNVLTGNAGANTLDGGLGNDVMAGGADNDTYVVDSDGDMVIEDSNRGADTVRASINYTLGANVEKLILTGADNLAGFGNELANTITGNAGANLIDGGLGADTMTGGTGDDIYRIDNSGDRVTETTGGGVDTIETGLNTFSLATVNNVENLTFTGTGAFVGTGNALGNTITGGNEGDTLSGGAGADIMIGGLGDDTYVVDHVGDATIEADGAGNDTVRSSISVTIGNSIENAVLTGALAINATGNALDNMLTGNTGANTLNGGAGDDVMAGGIGNDTYVVDTSGDVVVELSGQGTDTILSSLETVDMTALENVENATFTGAGNFTAIGNSLANILIAGSGDDVLSGNGGADTLRGEAGHDLLDGGSGADTMLGGIGDDTYIVDSTLDRVTELSNQGIDTVQSSVTLTLGTNVENLTLTGTAANGTGNTLANTMVGTALVNRLDGSSGNDTIIGGGGADTLIGGTGDDRLVIEGGSGSFARLDGGTGQDTLVVNGVDAAQLDLTLFANSMLSGIENVDISGDAGEANLLRLAIDDVRSLSTNANTLLSGSGFGGPLSNDSIVVYGNDGDLLDLAELVGTMFTGAHWQTDGSVNLGADTFDIMNYYDASGALLGTVAVDNDIDVI